MTAGADDAPNPGRLPVSLVVAVRDEEMTLGALVASIEAQTARPDEVVLVDGGSTDGTVALARAHADRDGRYLVVVADGAASPGRGRNLGIAAASHPWIAITDAGVRLEPTWLERLWQAHQSQPDARVVYGNFEFDTRSFFEECAAVAYGTPKRDTPAGRFRRPAVVSCLVHREAVAAVGGFPDLRAGEDMIFVQEVQARHIPVTWAPEATVWWRLRPGFWSTFERFRLYSYHNALAGQQPYWHHRMARGYLPVALGVVLGVVGSRRWFLLAGAPVAARAAVRLRRHEERRGWRWMVHPKRAGLVALLVVMNDLATSVGWWQATRHGAAGPDGAAADVARPRPRSQRSRKSPDSTR